MSAEEINKLGRELTFAERLDKACIDNPRVPTDGVRSGKQKWLREALLSRLGIVVTPEAVSRWFSGESRPRPKLMKAIADVLGTEEPWLALNIQVERPRREQAKRNAIASGAVNYVAALIQMNGGTIAFPSSESGPTDPDLTAIVCAQQLVIIVKLLQPKDGSATLRFQGNAENLTILAVVENGPAMSFDVIHIPRSVFVEHGRRRDGFTRLRLNETTNGEWLVGETPVAKIRAIADLIQD